MLLQGKMHVGKESWYDHLGWERLENKFNHMSHTHTKNRDLDQ